MPNRILREGLLDSEPIRKAGELAEILFARLMLVADDFGRFDGRVTVICRRCWPNGGPLEPDVLERLVKLTEQKLVVAYEVDGKPFIFIPKFKQRSRASKSKYPDPPASYPQEDAPMTVTSQTDDRQMTAVRARSSSFVVRNSNSNTDDPPAFVRPDWVDSKTWDDFIAMRVKIRKSPTDRAKDLIIQTLDQLRQQGYNPVAVLEQSIKNSWQDVFPIRQSSPKPATSAHKWRAGSEPDEVLKAAARALQVDGWTEGETHGQFRARIVEAGGEGLLKPGKVVT